MTLFISLYIYIYIYIYMLLLCVYICVCVYVQISLHSNLSQGMFTRTRLYVNPFYSIYHKILWGKFSNTTSSPKESLILTASLSSVLAYVCVCVFVLTWVCDLSCWCRQRAVNIKDSGDDLLRQAVNLDQWLLFQKTEEKKLKK